MIRYFIHVGDKTTAGGTVIDGAESTFGFGGQPLAVEGSKIQCPACGSVGVGVPVQPYRKHTIHGKQALLSDDLCLCQCNPRPKLIASRTDMSMSMSLTSDEAAALSAAALTGAGGAAASGSSAASSGSGSTPLSGAKAFEYGDATAGAGADTAARGVSEQQEADCYAEYERNLDECNMYRAITGDPYTLIACKQNAFKIYNQCRGF
ncbi:PAAR domain-containing protein [Paraburkholderia tropica]|uniref:PAAR domain-containing protein n=1 Tax=Paraburkholderia tropica TaxID=92647 RepID=UPI0030197AB8